MIKKSLRAKAFACALLAGTALAAAPAWASSPHPNLDANGVDLTDGTFSLALPVASVGSGSGALPLVAYDGQSDNWTQAYVIRTPAGSVNAYRVVLGNRYDDFNNGAGTSTSGTGARLTVTGDNSATYTTLEGEVYSFTGEETEGLVTNLCSSLNSGNCQMLAQSVAGKSGLDVSYEWTIWENCGTVRNPDGTLNCNATWRLARVSNNAGYSIAWTYASNSVLAHQNPSAAWKQRTSAALVNGTTTGTVSYGNPSTGVYTITTPGGKSWRITGSGTAISAVRRPSASTDTTSVSYASGNVSSVTKDGVTTGYSRSVSGTTATMVVTDALSHTSTIVSDMSKYRPTSVTDANGHTTGYVWDSIGRLTEIDYPEGNKIFYGYDTNGNLTSTTRRAKPSSTLPDVVTQSAYAMSCLGPDTCNTLSWSKDANGNQTDYAYDGTTGLLTAVTAPAPTAGATRPETRYSYTLDTWSGVHLLTGVSQCKAGAASSCVGMADEVKTTIAYNANLLPTSVAAGAGDARLTATTALTYDAAGNVLTVDGPLPGTDDTTTLRWSADRERLGVISADPDGAGPMKRRAVKTSYNADGQPTLVEQGTVNGTSDSDWAAFATLQGVSAAYDANGRVTTQSLVSGGTTYALTQTSYDALGRLQCTAQRMNPSAYGSLPFDACTLGTAGSYGNDRIVRTSYDNAGQVTLVQTGYGVTGTQADEVATEYNYNGTVKSVTDAENNKTSYVYDGIDRLSQTLYPSGTKGAGTSNSSDYEQLGYDPNGNVTSLRTRANETVSYSYDALGRLTAKTLPNSEPSVSYGYDLLGRMTSAATAAQTLSFAYDALGRNLTQAGPQGTVTSIWDLAGRRMRITHADGFYVDQDYLVTGELAHIRENGAASGVGVLATYVYDDLGRRTSITRGDGSTTSYTYDNASRLTQLAEDLPGTAYDQTLGFGYNPASQITSNTRSNDTYAWTGHYNVNRGYTANGLNQYTASGSVTPTYDARGNLTSAGSTTYTYSSENLLTAASGGITLRYDPATRLYETGGGSPGTTRFAYDGTDLIAEYNGSNALQRRYVHGPGTDEPIVWYEGSSTSDRRFLHRDERGSVVAVTDSSGTAISVNTYDEYGIPRSTNSGRFQYTGQTWLPELGMYYNKARIYSPTLGRFLQRDPIGFGGGMNLYAYVGADPINFADPDGQEKEIVVTGTRIKKRRTASSTASVGGSGGASGGVTGGGNGGGPARDTGDDCGGDCTSVVVVATRRPVPPKKDPPKSLSLSCGNIVDIVAGTVLITGAKTGLGAIPEGVEAVEFLRIIGIVSKFKLALVSTGVAAVGLAGGSIAYYYLRPQIISAICGK